MGPPETLLPAETEALDEVDSAGNDIDMLKAAAASHPASSAVWAALSTVSYDPDRPVDSYAYARVGYHRGLDALRKAGWKGQGAIPWSHEPNRGVLRCLYALRRAASAIGEAEEVERLTRFLNEADPAAADAIEAERKDAQQKAGPPTETIIIRSLD